MKVRDADYVGCYTCSPDESLVEVAKVLRDRKVRHLIVVDNLQKPIGILSSTDLTSKVIAEGIDPKKLTVQDVMNKEVVTVELDEPVQHACAEMIRLGTFSLPVTENGVLKGLLPFNNIVRHAQQKHEETH